MGLTTRLRSSTTPAPAPTGQALLDKLPSKSSTTAGKATPKRVVSSSVGKAAGKRVITGKVDKAAGASKRSVSLSPQKKTVGKGKVTQDKLSPTETLSSLGLSQLQVDGGGGDDDFASKGKRPWTVDVALQENLPGWDRNTVAELEAALGMKVAVAKTGFIVGHTDCIRDGYLIPYPESPQQATDWTAYFEPNTYHTKLGDDQQFKDWKDSWLTKSGTVADPCWQPYEGRCTCSEDPVPGAGGEKGKGPDRGTAATAIKCDGYCNQGWRDDKLMRLAEFGALMIEALQLTEGFPTGKGHEPKLLTTISERIVRQAQRLIHEGRDTLPPTFKVQLDIRQGIKDGRLKMSTHKGKGKKELL